MCAALNGALGLESALEEQVSGFILGLGPLVKSNEFYLAVNSCEVIDRLIKCGSIVINRNMTNNDKILSGC